MRYPEIEIAEYLLEKYPSLQYPEALELAVGIRKNEILAQGLGVDSKLEPTPFLEGIANQLGSIANSIDAMD